VEAMLIERYGANYDGAFFNSGMLAGAIAGYQFRADLHAVYHKSEAASLLINLVRSSYMS
jgi:hypothetical protein